MLARHSMADNGRTDTRMCMCCNHWTFQCVVASMCRYKKTLVVVSHDRGFLNEVTTDIVHLHDEALHYYRGNFANFEDMYEQRRRAANKEHEKFTKQMKNATVRSPSAIIGVRVHMCA